MKTIFINNENDYTSIISELSGKNYSVQNACELCEVCKEVAPLLCGKTLDAISAYREPCYAPTVHIEISKKNAYAMDDFFKNYEMDLNNDYLYLDTENYECHDTIEACHTEKVDFTFVIDDLTVLEKLISDVAQKLLELGENADFALNYLVPMDEGAIEYENGKREVGDPSLIWEIREGKVKNPNAKVIIFGANREALLYYGSTLVPNVLGAEWKRVFNVDIAIEI